MIKAKYVSSASSPDFLLLARDREKEVTKRAAETVRALRSRIAKRISTRKYRAEVKGYSEGLTRARAEYSAMLLELDDIYRQTVFSAHQNCLKVALTVAEKIINRRITDDQSILGDQIKNTLSELGAIRQARITVNPSDVEAMKESIGESLGTTVTINSSPEVSSGNARIETQSGSVQIAWQRHFALIKEQLLGKLAATKQMIMSEVKDVPTSRSL